MISMLRIAVGLLKRTKGYVSARREVPTQAQADQAQRMFDELGL